LYKSNEDFNQSKSSQGNPRSPGFTSFGDKMQKDIQNQNFVDPASLRPKHLQRHLSSSYQQENNSVPESSQKNTEDFGQSQSSGFSDSRMRSNRFEESQNENSSPQRISSNYQQKRSAPDEEIKNYISEQELFLKKLDDDRKKLNEKLKASQGPSNHVSQNQPIQKIPEKTEKSERAKASLPKSSHEEDEAIEELQKKAEDLLSRFMQPSKDINYSDSDNEDPGKSLFKSKAFEGSRSEKYRSVLKSQTKQDSEDESDDEQEENYTPEKSNRFKAKRRSPSPSDLDYSMSERDRVLILMN